MGSGVGQRKPGATAESQSPTVEKVSVGLWGEGSAESVLVSASYHIASFFWLHRENVA